MSAVILQSEHDRRIGVHYQFDSSDQPIGEGGMGRVYKGLCVNERTGSTRPVAVKFMFTDLPENAYERARREAEIQLRNDNLVEMLGFIETDCVGPDGIISKRYHVVSELLTGVSLSDVLEGKTKDRDGQDVPFAIKMAQDFKNDPEHFAVIVVRNVLSGLMALHDAGYIHRDIDPSNIMLTNDGHIKLIDFGIAKQMNSLTTGDKSLTVAGKFMGKPEYAAPELALGDIAHQNQTTDIYAVGILLYQCIVGHTPFEGSRFDVLDMQIKKQMPLNVIRNRALRNVIATACQKTQSLRYQTSAQMRVALENLNGQKQAMSPQKKKQIVGIVAGVIVVLAVILSVVYYRVSSAEEDKLKAEIAHQEQLISEKKSNLENELKRVRTSFESGKDRDNEGYEQILMSVYDSYLNCLNTAKEDDVLSVYEQDIVKQMTDVSIHILESIEQLRSQAKEFKEVGEEQLSEQYQQRADVLNEYYDNKCIK